MSSSSLSQETMLELMAYADGELEGAERSKIEALLGTDEEAVKFVEQIGGLGDFVKMIDATRDAKTVASFDIADQVMAGLEKPVPATLQRVTGIEAARKKKQSRTVGVVAVFTAFAIAASVFFFARPKETPMSSGPVAVQAVQQKQESLGVEVEQPGTDVSVMYMTGPNELTTSVVVWVDESAEK